jgi:hypothetical protein
MDHKSEVRQESKRRSMAAEKARDLSPHVAQYPVEHVDFLVTSSAY